MNNNEVTLELELALKRLVHRIDNLEAKLMNKTAKEISLAALRCDAEKIRQAIETRKALESVTCVARVKEKCRTI